MRDGTLVRIVWRRRGDTYCTRKLLFFRVEGMRPDALMRGGIKTAASTARRRDATIAQQYYTNIFMMRAIIPRVR